MRSKMMFDSYIDVNDELCQSGEVPTYNYSPPTTQFPKKCQHGTNVTGSWTGSKFPFVNLRLVSNWDMKENSIYNETAWKDEEFGQIGDCVDSKALIHAFGTLMPTASNLGFDPFNDPTRPLTTNVIVSDGKYFKFAAYQLNKTELTDASEVTLADFLYIRGGASGAQSHSPFVRCNS